MLNVKKTVEKFSYVDESDNLYYGLKDLESGEEIAVSEKYYEISDFACGVCIAKYIDDKGSESYDYIDINGNTYSNPTDKIFIRNYLSEVEKLKKKYISDCEKKDVDVDSKLNEYREELYKLYTEAMAKINCYRVAKKIRYSSAVEINIHPFSEINNGKLYYGFKRNEDDSLVTSARYSEIDSRIPFGICRVEIDGVSDFIDADGNIYTDDDEFVALTEYLIEAGDVQNKALKSCEKSPETAIATYESYKAKINALYSATMKKVHALQVIKKIRESKD